MFLLSSLTESRLPLPSAREILLVFHPPPPQKLPRKIEPAVTSRAAPPLFRYAPSQVPVLVLPPSAKGLNLALFGCAPERLANLSPEERAQCTGRLNTASLRGAYPGAPLDRSLEAERWEQAIRDRNTPPTVPCAYAGKVSNGDGAVMVDLVCLARLAAQQK